MQSSGTFSRAPHPTEVSGERAFIMVALDFSGAVPELWDLFARAASNRAFQRGRSVAFRLFRSRPRALGPFRARRIQQSLPERAFSGVYKTLPEPPQSSGTFSRAPHPTEPSRESV